MLDYVALTRRTASEVMCGLRTLELVELIVEVEIELSLEIATVHNHLR